MRERVMIDLDAAITLSKVNNITIFICKNLLRKAAEYRWDKKLQTAVKGKVDAESRIVNMQYLLIQANSPVFSNDTSINM